jgi:hypothetical protein
LFAVVLLLFASLGWAALSDYSFQQTTGAWTPLANPTEIHGADIDDSMSPVIEIGFSFMLDEVTYTQFKANSNGFITLNPSSTASLSNALATQTLIIGALWDDLKTNTGDGHVAYQLTGTAPNQVLTVEFLNMKWYYSTTNLVNFQIKLYQGTNRIEFIYGAMAASPGTSASASIGLSGATAGNFMSITPASPAASYSTTAEFTAINGTHVPFLTGNMYVFLPPVPADNDLAATGISGNQTPSVGAPATYTVTVYNRGSNAQSTYSVQLIDANNTVLASAAGPAIPSGSTLQVPVSWTPANEGPVALRGKVVLTGDENPNNDLTGVLNITVMPQGVIVVTVGDGSQTMRMPIDFFYRNSLNETLYFPTEIGMFGNITAISLYSQFTQDLMNMPVKVWLGSTTLGDLSAGWIPSGQLTQVYDGTVNFPNGENTILIPLQVPYAYTGGNLVVMFNRPMDTQYYNSTDYFKGQTVGTNRARNVYSDSTTYDPANPGTVGTVTGQFAKTSFHMTPLSPDPLFAINPSSQDFGTVLLDTTHNQTFTIVNAGGGTLTVSNISIAGSPFFTLQNLPTLPLNLATGQTATFTGRYNPTAAGTHSATISITDNMPARQVHTVALTGTAIDVTITALPYTQNFDAVTAPTLPIDWSSLFNPTGSNAVVVTYTSSPHTTPNCLRMYNGITAGTEVYAIAPPLATNIPANTVRMKLWVKAGGTGYTMNFGVMTDPLNAATYTQVATIAPTSAWVEYVVPFNAYTGAGRYLAIKHDTAGTGRTFYVDDVIMELIAANDLACSSLTGNTTPSVGNATTYTASIFNWGTNTQSTYTVKLMTTDNEELASSPGVTCAPGETVTVPLTWTPSEEGPMSIWGQVVLAGDPNPGNDQSPPLSISVMPAGMIVVTVGDGSQNARMPLDFYYRNSLNETLYYPTELGMFGNITAVSLYNQFVTTTLTSMPTKIWMGTTQLGDLSADWIPSTQLTLVFDGNVAYPGGANTIMIPLQTVFPYTGGNLVVMFNRPMDTTYYSSSDYFKCQTVGTNRARNIYSDSTTFDPAAPTGGTVTGQFAKTTFYMTPIGPDPVFVVNPPSKDFGTVLLDTTHSQNFTVMNAGGGTLTVSSIAIAGSPFYTLQNLPTLPVNLGTGQSATFAAQYHPTAAGTHAATITITDNRGARYEYSLGTREDRNRLPHTVALSGNCIDTTVNALPYTQAFDAVTAPALPVDWSSLIAPTGTNAVVVGYATSPHSNPNCVRMYNGSTTGTEVFLIAPPLATAIPVNTVRMKLWGKAGGTGYTINLGVMSDPLNAASYTQVATISPTTAWAEFTVAFNGYTGAGRYLAIKHDTGGTGRTFYVDDVLLEVIAADDLGATAISGNATPTVGTQETYTVSVFNWGTNPQGTYTVKLFSSDNTELATANGVACNPGQTVQVPVLWTPQAPGPLTIYGKVFLPGDPNPANDQSPNLNLLVNPSGIFTLTVGTGDQQARVPMDFYWKNSLFECMYYPAELGGFLGQITGVQFYNNFVTSNPNGATKIWLGTTTQTEFAANGWIPSTDLTLMFDGVVTYPSGENTITIPFAAPFMYLNGENIVMLVNRPMDAVYYSSSDNFYAQTVGTTRALKIYSDSTTYDPASPPTTGATLSGQFPKTTFFVIPGGVGHIQGTVLGAGNQPLEGVAVQILNTTYATTTNAQGQFQIQNVLPDDYTIQFSIYGYNTLTQDFVLEEDETEIINVTMQPMATVNVTGTILASDTGAGLPGAQIHLAGYANYDANSTATGAFTIPSVYANQPYAWSITCPGYTSATGNINVGATNYSMGNITLNEVAYAPLAVQAEANDINTQVALTWLAPDPNALEITESFEDQAFPPAEWTQTITNTGPANTLGIFPTWCRFGAVTISGNPANPTDGNYQSGLYWDYNHQDEWLVTPGFNCPPSAYLEFDSYVFLGSTNLDHYYIKVSTDNGNTWTVLWDASAQTGGWNYYASPITVDLSLYGGQQVKLAFNAVDGPNNDGLWYVWFIDNIYIGNEITGIRFASNELTSRSAAGNHNGFNSPVPTLAPSRRMEQGGIRTEPRLPFPHEVRYAPRTERVLTGYKVWRMMAGQEGNESSWTLLTPEQITALALTDTGWQGLPNGNYRWAVKAVYTNGVASVASLSNILLKETITGMIAGVVRRPNTTPIVGATVTAGGVNATTNNAGAYTLVVPVGTYSVTATATGYQSQTVDNVGVTQNQTTTVNFILAVVDNDDQVVPVTATELIGNYPNPFNPETTISYSVKDGTAVRLEIYNAKGQRVRTLVDETQPTGRYNAVFNGRDDHGRPLSSGVYFYRFSAGDYRSTRKMILMQ